MKLLTIERYKPRDIALLLHLGPLLLMYLLWLDARPSFLAIDTNETYIAFGVSLLVAANVVFTLLRNQLANFVNILGLSWASLSTLNHFPDSPSSFLILFTLIFWLIQHLVTIGGSRRRQAIALADYPWKIGFASASFTVIINLLAHYMKSDATHLIYAAVNYSNFISLFWILMAISKHQITVLSGSLLQAFTVGLCLALLYFFEEMTLILIAESTAFLVYLSFLHARPAAYLKRATTKTADLLFKKPEASVVIYFFS